MLGIITTTYAQKVDVKTYTVVCETCKELRLDDYAFFDKNAQYSHINSEMIVGTVFKKRDTMIWYYLLNNEDRKIYNQIEKRIKEDYVKKYGKIYKVKRTTPILN